MSSAVILSPSSRDKCHIVDEEEELICRAAADCKELSTVGELEAVEAPRVGHVFDNTDTTKSSIFDEFAEYSTSKVSRCRIEALGIERQSLRARP